VSKHFCVAGFAIFLVCAAPEFVRAANICVMVVETGAVSKRNVQHDSEWENGVMDAFFNAGHIVSNSHKLLLPGGFRETLEVGYVIPDEILPDVENAFSSGADYFVLTQLDYAENNGKIKNPMPSSIVVVLYSRRVNNAPEKEDESANTFAVSSIMKEDYVWSNKNHVREEYFNALRAVRQIMPYIGSII
jgi:hypothetical protein